MSTLRKSLTSKEISASLVAARGCQSIAELGFLTNRGALFFRLSHEVQGAFLIWMTFPKVPRSSPAC